MFLDHLPELTDVHHQYHASHPLVTSLIPRYVRALLRSQETFGVHTAMVLAANVDVGGLPRTLN
jgi:hypothetical protein